MQERCVFFGFFYLPIFRIMSWLPSYIQRWLWAFQYCYDCNLCILCTIWYIWYIFNLLWSFPLCGWSGLTLGLWEPLKLAPALFSRDPTGLWASWLSDTNLDSSCTVPTPDLLLQGAQVPLSGKCCLEPTAQARGVQTPTGLPHKYL